MERQNVAMDHRPSPWLSRYIGGVPAGGNVLDLACGGGRHVSPLLERGCRVTAVDRDTAEVRRRFSATPGHRLSVLDIDLEAGGPFPFPPASFAGVVVFNYLWRPILRAIIAAVAPGGVLIYETF